MLFNSFEFLVLFLPAVVLAFNFAKQRGPLPAQVVLLLASLGFYAWWDWRFAPLLLSSLLFNHRFGRWLSVRPTLLRLWIGILVNLSPLIWFKYMPWFGSMHVARGQSLVLPLGISFFTFLQIAYLSSIYRLDHRDDGFVPYAVFVTYFPHLIAGPILKLREFVPQVRAIDALPVQFDERFARGLLLLVAGLFKKVVVADAWCSGLARAVFDHAQRLTLVEAWTGALAYTCQLYFDFSGYCEMALGMSLLMGIAIPVNFLSPYRSRSIGEFWRRWHISLGSWFREHVYVPLGGSRHGLARSCVALSLTMLLCGLWHGAGWTFVAWGALHGAYLVVHRVWSASGRRLDDRLALVLTLLAVIVGWVLFRAQSLDDAAAILRSMSGLNGLTLPQGFATLSAWLPWWLQVAPSDLVWGHEPLLLCVLVGWCATAPNIHEIDFEPTLRTASATCAGAVIALFALNNGSTFLYANF